MLSNLSSANSPVNENSVIQKAQNDYAEIDQRVDDLETEVAENTAALNQQGAQITSLANKVADVAAKTTFPTLNTNRINSAGAGSVTVGSSLNVTGNVNAPNATISGSLTVGGTNFNTVRDNAATAAANASTALTKANQAVTKANATEAALNEYKDQIANSVSTDSANISGGVTVGETVNANDVVSNEGHFGSIETPSIDVKEIKSSGSLELPAQMSTPNDWFTITVPNGITATFSGSYQGKKYKFTVDKGNIEYDQDVLELIKDVSFKRSDNNVRIRVKADKALTYSFTDTGAVEPISIQKSTEAYADYSYAPQKARGTIYKGFDDRTSEVQIPGVVCASILRADEQEYVISAAECQVISKKLYLPDDWDETGMISCTSGTDNQYVSNDTKDGCVSPTWKTPVETAVDGVLSNTKCLITEKAVSEYNGTVDNGTDIIYPITNIGDDACVHGKLTAECLCGTCCVQGEAACFHEDVQADCFNGNCLVICNIYGKAPVYGTSKVIVHDDTEFMNTTTFDENSCFKKKIVVDCDADFGEDVHIAGDLYVNGVSHVVDEETIETPSNEIMLRQNATTGLANTEISGILINKYNGTDSLTVGTDNMGTLRVGTGIGTSTSYATICHNQSENKWYVSDTEVTPAGVLQSYATKTEEDPYTVYTDAVFLAIDKTSLEPVLTRDEEVDMTQCGITYWDATNTKAKTASKIKYNNNGLDFDGKTCIEATQTTITDGTDTTTIDATKVESKCGCFTDVCVECTITSDVACACTCIEAPLICASTCLEACDGKIECNFLICGSLTVCGPTVITGLMSDCVATSETNCNDTFYVPIVHCNNVTQGANTVCTDGAFKYNPNSNTLCVENVCFTDTSCITCACVEDGCINNLCIGTVVTNADATKSATYCVTCVTGNTDFAIPVYNKNVTNVNSTKKAELSYVNQSNGPRYNPITNTFCVCCISAASNIRAGNVLATKCVVSELEACIPSGGSTNLVLDARCKNSSGTICSHATTFCGLDGKIYNDYGFVGPNNYHNCVPMAMGSTKYFEIVPRDNTSSNRSLHLDFTIYNANYSINLFYCSCGCWMVRSFDDNRSVYEQAAGCAPYGILGFSEGDDKKHLFFCYTNYSAMTIDGDQQFTVNMCSSNPTSCNYRNSYSRIACGAECLYDYACHGWVERYNGLLRGAWCIEATDGQVTIAHDCDNNKYGCIGALTNGIISVQKCEYMNPFYPADAINWMYKNWADISDIVTVRGFQCLSYGYLPAYASKTCCSNYTRNRGFLISGGTITCSNGCCLGGYVFGLVGQCDSNKNWCSLPRAVYGYRNVCCKDCVVQSGVWCNNKLYELIDERGGQTIDGTLTVKSLSSAPTTLRHTPSSTSPVWFKIGCIRPTSSLSTQHLDLFVGGSGIIDTISLDLVDAVANKPIWKISHPYGYDGTSRFTCLCLTGETSSWICPVTLWAQVTPYKANEYFDVSVYNRNITSAWHPELQKVSSPTGPSIFSNALCVDSTEISGCYKADYIYACKFIDSNPVGCTASVTGNAGSILQGGVFDLYSATPAIDFHHNNASADYSHRIIALNGGLRITATDATGSSAVTKASNFDFKCDGSAVFVNTLCIGTSTGSTIYNYTNGTSLHLGTNSVAIGKASWQGYDCCNVAIGYCACACCRDSVAIGRCVSSSYDNAVTIGAVSSASWSGVAIGAIDCAGNCGIAIGYSTSACGASSIGIGQDAKACGDKSVAIGFETKACQGYAIAIGCGARAAGAGAAMGVGAYAACQGVSLGNQAYTDIRSIAVGNYVCANAQHAIAIGACAKANIAYSIAIGEGANTNVYGASGTGACILVDERTDSIRRSIICWSTATKQSDLFCAIYCRFDFNKYDTSSTVYVSVTGVYGNDTLNEIKWDKNETNPMNFDLGRQGFHNAITVWDGCTCAIPKAGYVQIVGYSR